jgi:hypothetical protein
MKKMADEFGDEPFGAPAGEFEEAAAPAGGIDGFGEAADPFGGDAGDFVAEPAAEEPVVHFGSGDGFEGDLVNGGDCAGGLTAAASPAEFSAPAPAVEEDPLPSEDDPNAPLKYVVF